MGVGRSLILLTVYYIEYHVFGYIFSLILFIFIGLNRQKAAAIVKVSVMKSNP